VHRKKEREKKLIAETIVKCLLLTTSTCKVASHFPLHSSAHHHIKYIFRHTTATFLCSQNVDDTLENDFYISNETIKEQTEKHSKQSAGKRNGNACGGGEEVKANMCEGNLDAKFIGNLY
jgi:hypothetical protein